MMKIGSVIWLGVFLAFFVVSCQQESSIYDSPNMPLWEFENKMGQKSYLLGTTEYLNSDSARKLFNSAIINAFDTSQVFVAQMDVPNSDFDKTKAALEIAQGKTIKELLSEEDFEWLKALKKSWEHGGDSTFLEPDSTKLRLVFYLHDMVYFRNQSSFYFDKFWMERAMPQGKTIGGLETYDAYYEGFLVMNTQEELSFMKSISSMDEFTKELRDSSQNYYLGGEFEKINSLYLSKFPYLQTHYNQLVVSKHAAWAQKIKQSMDTATTFVALDVVHLTGESNLIKELLSKGYTANRIQ